MQYVISNEAYVTKMEAYGREQAVAEEIIDLKAWIPTFFRFHHHLKKKKRSPSPYLKTGRNSALIFFTVYLFSIKKEFTHWNMDKRLT